MIGLRDVGIALAVSRTTGRDERDASLSDTVVSGDGSDAPVLHAPLVVSGELLGLMVVRGREGHRFRTEHRDLATTVVSQTAVAVKKIQLLERLSERNLTKDFFDDLAGGAEQAVVEGRARRLRCDLRSRGWCCGPARRAPTRPTGPGALEASLAAAFRGALIER